jgi:hypothetical protein
LAVRSKYIVIDREIEEGFIVGDMKVIGAIIGRSPRTIEKWLYKARYKDYGRFIIVKNPIFAKREVGHVYSTEFLKRKFVKK